MRGRIIAAAAAGLLATSGFAFAAAQTTEGVVKTYAAATHQLTLQDGTVFHLPSTFKDPGIQAGKKLRITWDMQNGEHMASAVVIEN